MIINDNLKLSNIAIANIEVNGFIGTASSTVDICSSFNINQVTRNVILHLPNPTDISRGDIVFVNNIGVESFIMHSSTILPDKFSMFS
jgi:hypothetical protein